MSDAHKTSRRGTFGFVFVLLYGVFNVFIGVLFGFISSVYFTLIGPNRPAGTPVTDSLLELEATMFAFGVAIAPTALAIGILMLLNAWILASGWRFARYLARGLFLLSVLGYACCSAYGLSLRPTLLPTPIMTFFPGVLGIVIQAFVVIAGIIFWITVIVFVWRLFGPEKAPQT